MDQYTDVVEICAILQCLGFNVKSMDSSDGNISQDGGTKTVVINCQSSGLQVVLESVSAPCTCPPTDLQNSGFWQVEAVSGGKQHGKECGSALLGSFSNNFKERLSKELRELVKSIKQQNESSVGLEKVENANADLGNKSSSMLEMKTTPERRLQQLKADTPTRYRSLDTLTNAIDSQLPPPGSLMKKMVASDTSNDDIGQAALMEGVAERLYLKRTERIMCRRQSTYTVASTPGSVKRQNKTSSPIQPHNNVLDNLIAAERSAEDLRSRLASIIREWSDDAKNDSSISSLALDVSKISLLKGAESKAQFASSPNLSGLSTLHETQAKSKLRRFESSSTSNLTPGRSTPKEGTSKLSKLRRLSPNFFKSKKDSSILSHGDKGVKENDSSKIKYNGLLRPRIVTPVRVPRGNPEGSPNLSSKKKFSHIKSTIPRASAKKE